MLYELFELDIISMAIAVLALIGLFHSLKSLTSFIYMHFNGISYFIGKNTKQKSNFLNDLCFWMPQAKSAPRRYK